MTAAQTVAIDGVVRAYPWGSTDYLQHLLGSPVDGYPAAELWFGAHPDDPSAVCESGHTLDGLIAADPVGTLGPEVLERFGARLPFLLKILAVRTSLSVQVHPTLEQARAGYAREEGAGTPQGAADRVYRDANHKPELLCALTPFEALCGFRTVPVIRDVLAALGVPELSFIGTALDEAEPLRAAFTAVLTHPDIGRLSGLVGERAEGRGDMLRGVALTAQDYPGDVGVVLALLLNYVRLQPGEALYLGAGNVHAYLRGAGVEIMANSDNVLRCGLTPKHIDVPELLAVTEFVPLEQPLRASLHGLFDVPVPDFRLVRLDFTDGDVTGPVALDDPGPCIVLCATGAASVAGIDVTSGRAVFVPAGQATTINGDGLVFVASVGL